MNTVTPNMEHTLRLIDELDLEPIAFKLVHPEPGELGMSIDDADILVTKYRRFLKLCAMYPQQGIVPSKEIDPVWHAHILDTEKYAFDCNAIFGGMLHHFPYLGSRSMADLDMLHQKGAETRTLYKQHFGEDMNTGSPVEFDGAVAMCDAGGCDGGCERFTSNGGRERPRLERV